MAKYGKAIQSIRKSLGLTQQDLADKIEASNDFISRLEKDMLKKRSSLRLEEVCNALEISCEELEEIALQIESQENPAILTVQSLPDGTQKDFAKHKARALDGVTFGQTLNNLRLLYNLSIPVLSQKSGIPIERLQLLEKDLKRPTEVEKTIFSTLYSASLQNFDPSKSSSRVGGAELARRINGLRKMTNTTWLQIAAAGGPKQSTIVKMEKLNRFPKAETLKALASYFGTSVSALLDKRVSLDEIVGNFSQLPLAKRIGLQPKEAPVELEKPPIITQPTPAPPVISTPKLMEVSALLNTAQSLFQRPDYSERDYEDLSTALSGLFAQAQAAKAH